MSTKPRGSRCVNGARHVFAYTGQPGTSAPTCQRIGCGASNLRYDQTRDTDPDASVAHVNSLIRRIQEARQLPEVNGDDDEWEHPAAPRPGRPRLDL